MDFGALPPEINSARMYSGPGPATMLAAAAAWDQVGGELNSAASYYRSVLSEITTESWQGPSSVSMAAAAAPQIEWLTAAGAQAEQTAGQARAAVSAYEAAVAMTVPPPLITANRAQLMTLVATNFLGQNTPAIAATEIVYAEMWAQDAAAMYGYAGASAVAAALPLFGEPPQTVNPGGLAGQVAAVGQAVGTAIGTDVAAELSRVVSSLPAALATLASPLSEDPLLGLDLMLASVSAVTATVSITASLTSIAGTLTAPAQSAGGASSPGAVLASAPGGDALGPAQFGRAAALANVGRSAGLGGLSVPPNWAANAVPATDLAALPCGSAGSAGAAAALEGGAFPSLLGAQPPAPSARAGRSFGLRTRPGRSVIPRTVCAG